MLGIDASPQAMRRALQYHWAARLQYSVYQQEVQAEARLHCTVCRHLFPSFTSLILVGCLVCEQGLQAEEEKVLGGFKKRVMRASTVADIMGDELFEGLIV